MFVEVFGFWSPSDAAISVPSGENCAGSRSVVEDHSTAPPVLAVTCWVTTPPDGVATTEITDPEGAKEKPLGPFAKLLNNVAEGNENTSIARGSRAYWESFVSDIAARTVPSSDISTWLLPKWIVVRVRFVAGSITNICPEAVAIAASPPPPAMLQAAPTARYFGAVARLAPSNTTPDSLPTSHWVDDVAA